MNFPKRFFLGGPWAQVYDLLQDMSERLEAIRERIETMPTRADIDAAKAELQQALTDATNRVVATITDLQTQLANGNPVTDQDLADLKADVQAAAAIDPAPTPPPTP